MANRREITSSFDAFQRTVASANQVANAVSTHIFFNPVGTAHACIRTNLVTARFRFSIQTLNEAIMSTPCSPTASPNPRKRACPDEDTKAEADIQMEGADENGEVVLSSPVGMPCDDSPSAANKKAKVEGTTEDSLTRESLAATANNEAMQDQMASSEEMKEAALLASNKPPPPTKRKKLTFAEKQAQDQEKARKVCDLWLDIDVRRVGTNVVWLCRKRSETKKSG